MSCRGSTGNVVLHIHDAGANCSAETGERPGEILVPPRALLGLSDEIHRLQQSSSQQRANALSVRLELQADCLAGVWGNHANHRARMLEPGDTEEGLRAAAAIGDDRLQQRSGGRAQPESWTHGSSEMRVRWLRRGLESGDLDACDTFQREDP